LNHFLSRLVGGLVSPLAWGFLIFVAGAIFRLSGRRRIATVLWSTAGLLVYLSAVAPVANALLAPLESRYPPLADTRKLLPVRYIVVLGSSYTPRDGIPITAALGGDALPRIAEGVRLMRQMPGVKLVVSGGATENWPPSALGYAEFAREFGVDEASIVKLDRPRDTAEEATVVSALVGDSPFILVTSAYHMPRAMRLMRAAGTHPIPAPTGQLVSRQVGFDARRWLPQSASIVKTERALHEYIGLAFTK
jgi:uncharacterized SAM-binding protein YcdF (DUF218 family)